MGCSIASQKQDTEKFHPCFLRKRGCDTPQFKGLKNNIGDSPVNVGVFSKNVGDFPKNVGDFPKNVGDFPKNVGVFLDASEEITASPTNFSQRVESPTVKKTFKHPSRACARPHTTAILHFLLSQPSPIFV